jgi:hypothetical protein
MVLGVDRDLHVVADHARAESRGRERWSKRSGMTPNRCVSPASSAAPPSHDPDSKDQKNFTDPESRIMKGNDGFSPVGPLLTEGSR